MESSSLKKPDFPLRLLFLNQTQILDNQVLTDVNFILSPIIYTEKSRHRFGRWHSFISFFSLQRIQYQVVQRH